MIASMYYSHNNSNTLTCRNNKIHERMEIQISILLQSTSLLINIMPSIIIIPSSYLFYLLTYILQFNLTINSDLLPTVPILIFSHSNVYFVSLIIASSPLSYNTEEKGKNTMRSDRLQFKTIYPYILVVNDLRN